MKTDFDLKEVEIFCHVVRLGSFSEAAKAMSLTQPTASAHVASLERTLGARLLDRKGRRVFLTAEGKTFLDYAREMLALRERAKRALHKLTDRVKGGLSIGGSTIPGTYILPSLIGRFKSRYPEVQVTSTIGDSQRIVDHVRQDLVEVGVVGSRPTDRALTVRKLWEDELVLVVPADHEHAKSKSGLSLKKAIEESFILREKGSGTRQLLERVFKTKGIRINDLNTVCKLGSTEAVKQGIKEGLGVSILSRRAVEDEVKNGLFRTLPIRGVKFTRFFYLVTHTSRTRSPACRVFLVYLVSRG